MKLGSGIKLLSGLAALLLLLSAVPVVAEPDETAAAQDNSVTCPWWIFKGPEGVEEPFGTAFQNYVAGNADRDETKEVLTQLFVDAYDAM